MKVGERVQHIKQIFSRIFGLVEALFLGEPANVNGDGFSIYLGSDIFSVKIPFFPIPTNFHLVLNGLKQCLKTIT